MLPIKSLAAALVAFGVAAALAAYSQQHQEERQDRLWDQAMVLVSMKRSAAEMNVELTDECQNRILAHLAEYGHEQWAVTDRGSVIIRSAGKDTWVC